MADEQPSRGEPGPLLPDLTPEEARRLPRLLPADYEWVFIGHYYDGPLAGLLRRRGELLFCHIVWPRPDPDEPEGDSEEDPGPEGPRTLAVYRLTERQMAEERHWQRLFERHVGTHWSVDKSDPVPASEPTGRLQWFYDEISRREPLDLRGAEIVGWIEA